MSEGNEFIMHRDQYRCMFPEWGIKMAYASFVGLGKLFKIQKEGDLERKDRVVKFLRLKSNNFINQLNYLHS